ncbi:MAG: SBBP repeat-containing protein [Bacteroidia bacterium]|nr:SBBP repeat-containing protein [Bacteroidia bacterium]MDW8158950.1 SBBP repeat-containing protein [Bacteroidia bacterium]
MRILLHIALSLLLLGSTYLPIQATTIITPLRPGFIQNAGQIKDEKGNACKAILFKTHLGQQTVYFQKDAFSYVFYKTSSSTLEENQSPTIQQYRVDLRFLNTNPDVQIIGVEPHIYQEHHYTSKESYICASSFQKIIYKNIYPLIDLVVYKARGENALKYDFVIHPGGNPKDICMQYIGANSSTINKDGTLQVITPLGNLWESAPLAYQTSQNTAEPVSCYYQKKDNKIKFLLGRYDSSLPLIIDPLTRLWATYLGGNRLDRAYSVTHSVNGNITVAGLTQSDNFPTTAGAIQTFYAQANDIFVAQYLANGTLRWATYYGGSSIDQATAIATDAFNNIYVTGYSSSSNFPTTIGPEQAGGGDIFLIKLRDNGSREWAQLYGGTLNDIANNLTIDNSNNIIVTGATFSSNFLTTNGAFQREFAGVRDAFVVKFDPNGDRVWSTFLGGSGDDQGFGITTDISNNIYVSGSTESTNFPVTANAFQPNSNGGTDVFISKISPTGRLLASTYFGSTGNETSFGLAVTFDNKLAVIAQTNSTTGLSSTTAFQTAYGGGGRDGLIAKFNLELRREWVSYLGGQDIEDLNGITTDRVGNIYITGGTRSANFPTVGGAIQSTYAGSNDAFIAVISTANQLTFSSFYGGDQIEIGRGISWGNNTVCVVGQTSSFNFPTRNPAQNTNGGADDAFVLLLQTGTSSCPTIEPDIISFNVSCTPPGAKGSILVNDILGGVPPYRFFWSGPNNFTSTSQNLNNLVAGDYTLIVRDNNGCEGAANVQIIAAPALQISSLPINCGVNLTVSGGTGSYSYLWTGPNNFRATTRNLSATTNGNYFLTVTDENGCRAEQIFVVTGCAACPPFLVRTDTTLTCTPPFSTTLRVTGGTPPYRLVINQDNITSPNGIFNLQNLPTRGPINITLTDNIGCLQRDTLLLATPTGPSIIGAVNNCNINLTISGGAAPYTFNWSGPNNFSATTSNLVGLTRNGNYTVAVRDNNGCTAGRTFAVTNCEGACPGFSLSVDTAQSCIAPYRLAFTISRGRPPYEVSLVNIGTQITATGRVAFDNLTITGPLTIRIVDANNCVETQNITIPTPAGPVIRGVVNGCGITTSVVRGSGPFLYSWSGPRAFSATTPNIAGLTIDGEYTLTVQDINGCRTITRYTVTACEGNCPGLVLNVLPFNRCIAPFTLSLQATGGIPPYTFTINGTRTLNSSDGRAIFDNLPTTGPYSIRVTDRNNCSTRQQVTIPTPQGFTISGLVTNCSIAITTTGGTPPFTYFWSGPAGFTSTTQNIAGLANGTYTVTAQDANGCSSNTASFNVTACENCPTFRVIAVDIACPGLTDGSIDIVTGNIQPGQIVEYSIGSNFVSNNRFRGLAKGFYTVRARVIGNPICNFEQLVEIKEPLPLQLINVQVQNVGCAGTSTGSLRINVTGGTQPYVFRLNNIPQTATRNTDNSYSIVGLASGIAYNLEVRDANNCNAVTAGPFVLSEPRTIAINIIQQTNVACKGGATGALRVGASGGTPPYTFSLGGLFNSTGIFNNLIAGEYTLLVTDANNCSATRNLSITEPPLPLAAEIAFTNDARCATNCNGIIVAQALGGTPPYRFSINGGNFQTLPQFNDLCRGEYLVTVIDQNNCSAVAQAQINEPPALALQSSAIQGVDCFGACTGGVEISVIGGTPPYTYFWSNGSTAKNLVNACAGSYTVTITDRNGCTISNSFSIPTTSGLAVTSFTNDVRCHGQNNGSLTVSVSGGTPPYSYSWADAPSVLSPTRTGLAAGNYCVNITDSRGCRINNFCLTIRQPEPIQLVSSNVSRVSCIGAEDGKACINVSGGQPPYSYAWSNGSTLSCLERVRAGNYSVLVIDRNGCSAPPFTITINEPSPITGQVLTTNPSCFGSEDGVIRITSTTGGTPPYQYSLDGVSFTSGTVFTKLRAGEYTVYIRDARNCTTRVNAVLTQPSAINFRLLFKANIACAGLSDGKIIFTARGGTGAGFIYRLNDRPFSRDTAYDGLPPGVFQITVRDQGNGCEYTFSDTLLEPQPLILEQSKINVVSCNTGIANFTFTARGGTTINANGQTVPYQFQLETLTGALLAPYSNNSEFRNLVPGNYRVRVRDYNNCTTSTIILVPFPITFVLSKDDAACPNQPSGRISIQATNGYPPYKYSLDGVEYVDSPNFNSVLPGFYLVTVRDAQGCTASQEVTISSPLSLNPRIFAQPATISCQTQPVLLTALTNGNFQNIRYQWWLNNNPIPGATSNTFLALTSGNYQVAVTNLLNNCTEFSNVTSINILPNPTPTIRPLSQGVTTTLCKGQSLVLVARSNLPIRFYNWYRNGVLVQGGIDSVYTVFETGNYTVQAISIQGCNGISETFTVTVNALPEVELQTPSSNVLCRGQRIQLRATEFSTWNYEWLLNGTPIPNATNASTFEATEPGTYAVKVTNRNTGCFAITNSIVLRPNLFHIDLEATDPLGCGSATGNIRVQVRTPTGSTFYALNNGPWINFSETFRLDNLPSDKYQLQVKDTECSILQQIELTVAKPSIRLLNRSDNFIDLAWNSIPGAIYTLQYRVVGASEWKEINNITNGQFAFSGAPVPSIRISDLQHQTQYEFRILTRCLNNIQSAFTPPLQISTLTRSNANCLEPSNIYVQSLPSNPSEALVYFTIPRNSNLVPVCYDIRYRPMNAGFWSSIRVFGNVIPVRLERLLSNTRYELQIRTNCVNCPGQEANEFSVYSPFIEFVTGGNCPSDNQISINNNAQNNVACGHLALRLDPSIAQSNNSYQWFYSETGLQYREAPDSRNSIEYIAKRSGFYRVKVGIGNCEPVFSAPIFVEIKTTPGVIANTTPVSCAGLNDGVLIAGCTGENEACEDALGRPDYEFSLDGINWFASGIFTQLAPRTYTVYIRKKSTGCVATYTHPVFTTVSAPELPEPQVQWIGGSTIEVKWNPIVNAIGYQLAYRIRNEQSSWQTIEYLMPYDPNNTQPIIVFIDGLQRNATEYEVRLRVRCSRNNQLGPFGPSRTVIIEPNPINHRCPAPGGVFVSSVQANRAILHWQNVPSASSYIVEYREINQPNFIRVEQVLGNQYEIHSLQSGVQYVARVYARCSQLANDISASSINVFFITNLVPKVQETSEIPIKAVIYPNPNKGSFMLKIMTNADYTEKALIHIYNPEGKKILETEILLEPEQTSIAFNEPNLPPGIYLLHLAVGDRKIVEKVLVQE